MDKLLNTYARYTNKEKVYEDILKDIRTNVPNFVSSSASPERLDTKVPARISSDYLNKVFSYFSYILDYLYKVAYDNSELLNNEANIIQSQYNELISKIENLDIWLDNLSTNNPLNETKNFIINGPITLQEKNDTPIYLSYLDEERVYVELPSNTYTTTISKPLFALDNNKITAWTSVVRSNSKIKNSLEGIDSTGALCRFVITMERATPINKFYIKTNDPHAPSVRKFIFYLGDKKIEKLIDEFYITEKEIRFDTIVCDRIDVILEQEHYIIVDGTKIITDDLKQNIERVGNVSTDEHEQLFNLTKMLLSRYLTVDEEYVNSLLSQLGIDTITKYKQVISNQWFEYTFTFQSLEPHYVSYQPYTEWESMKYQLNNNVQEIELYLETTTTSNDLISCFIETDLGVEYPILPINNSLVRERVFPNNFVVEPTFNYTGDITLFLDGEIHPNYTSVISNTSTYLVLLDSQLPEEHIYYLEYSPVYSALSLYTTDHLVAETEFKVATNSNFIDLQYNPFINFDIINHDDFSRKDDFDATYIYEGTTFTSIANTTYGIYNTGTVTFSGSLFTFSTPFSTSEIVPGYWLYLEDSILEIATVPNTTTLTVTGDTTSLTTETNLSYSIAPYSTGAILTYEPLQITIDGIKAKNITNYEKSENNLFTNQSEIQFLQKGKQIFFNKSSSSNATIGYGRIYAYLKTKIKLSNSMPLDTGYTPEINKIELRIKPRL